MFGVGYSIHRGHELGFNTEISWHDSGMDEAFDYRILTFGIRWVPGLGH
jgi:hypothetical protein